MTEPTSTAPPARLDKVTPGALQRYRVMAVITGVLLILVCVGMLRYTELFNPSEGMDEALRILAQVHGFVYMVYLLTVLQLWLQARWGYGRLATMFFGGIVPLLSFFVERRITHEVRAAQEA